MNTTVKLRLIIILLVSFVSSCVLKSQQQAITQLYIEESEVSLSPQERSQLTTLSIDLVESSNFTSKGNTITFDEVATKKAYQETLKSDHLKITFVPPIDVICNGDQTNIQTLVIGPIEGEYVKAPYGLNDTGELIAFAKYSGPLAVELKAIIDTISN